MNYMIEQWIKLILILIGGFVVWYIGNKQIKANRLKREKEIEEFSKNYNSSDDSELTETEKKIKDYIDTYKNNYQKDAMKNALLSAGYDETTIDKVFDLEGL